jgi:hypothetical protein
VEHDGLCGAILDMLHKRLIVITRQQRPIYECHGQSSVSGMIRIAKCASLRRTLRYVHAFLDQTSNTAVANGRAKIEREGGRRQRARPKSWLGFGLVI